MPSFMKILTNQKRQRLLNEAPAGDGAVVYVMAREQRIHDNWALIRALEIAAERQVPVLVLFPLAPMISTSARHNEWMITSLREVSSALAVYDIPFCIEYGDWEQSIPGFVKRHDIGEVVFDFNPLQPVTEWVNRAAALLPVRASMVDARNIVPAWEAAPKAAFAAYTFRPRIHRLLPEYLTEFPPLKQPTVPYSEPVPPVDWEVLRAYRACDHAEPIPNSFVPGETAASAQLARFLANTLPEYHLTRNDPNEFGVSALSPYLRWGNISAQRVALAVRAVLGHPDAKEAFLEELIVRRELADNYCFYTTDQLSLASMPTWAQATLEKHRSDPRPYLYSYETLAAAATHDPLWNAAQQQMVEQGKMHGYLRMYWAKKILEWTTDPETAIAYAIQLNDHYELDGQDSNGVVGVMWSIAGLHDRAWPERPVFGKIRYMNYAGCKRKFDVKNFETRYANATPTSLFT